VADATGKMLNGLAKQLNAGAAGLGGMHQAAMSQAGNVQRANQVREAIMRQVCAPCLGSVVAAAAAAAANLTVPGVCGAPRSSRVTCRCNRC